MPEAAGGLAELEDDVRAAGEPPGAPRRRGGLARRPTLYYGLLFCCLASGPDGGATLRGRRTARRGGPPQLETRQPDPLYRPAAAAVPGTDGCGPTDLVVSASSAAAAAADCLLGRGSRAGVESLERGARTLAEGTAPGTPGLPATKPLCLGRREGFRLARAKVLLDAGVNEVGEAAGSTGQGAGGW